MSSEQRGHVDRKGKGKAKDQNANQSESENEDRQKGEGQDQRNDREGGQQHQQQMKEIRRPPPLPAVKGTIGAIESPSRRSFFSGSPTSTVRGNHSRGPSYDVTHRRPESPSPYSQQQQQQQQQQPQEDLRIRDRPVFRSDPTLTSCFDRLRLAKKEEIRSLFNA